MHTIRHEQPASCDLCGPASQCFAVAHACYAVALQSTHEDKDYIHIVMELCQGGELFDHIVEAQHFTERKVSRCSTYIYTLPCTASSITHHAMLQTLLLEVLQEFSMLAGKASCSCICAVRHMCCCAGIACRLHTSSGRWWRWSTTATSWASCTGVRPRSRQAGCCYSTPWCTRHSKAAAHAGSISVSASAQQVIIKSHA